MKSFLPRLILVSMVCALAGCTWGNAVSYDTHRRPPTNPASVQVVHSSTTTRPYHIIGTVSADSGNPRSALASCKKEAAALGAHAIMDFAPNGNQTGAGMLMQSGLMVGSMQGTGWSAKAIVWQ